MAFKTTFYAILFCTVVAQYSAYKMTLLNKAEISPKLKLVASVDGKSFFADNDRKNWTDASSYCQGLGMKLASITSDAQFKALANARSSDFDHWYWTSGRDSRILSQFVWNNTNEELSPNYLNFEDISWIPYQTCVIFQTTSDPTESVLFPYLCSDTTPGSLCET